jgi:hypothetical protein
MFFSTLWSAECQRPVGRDHTQFHALKLGRWSSDSRIMLFSSAPPMQPGAEISQFLVSIGFTDGGETTQTVVRREESAHFGG